MTTCELCGDTGLYSPSAVPCPKGCKDVVERLRSYAKDQGGWHNIDDTCDEAAEVITNMRAYISDLEKRDKDTREKLQTMHRRAQIAEGACKGVLFAVDSWIPHLKNPAFREHDIIVRSVKEDFERAIKKARALQEGR